MDHTLPGHRYDEFYSQDQLFCPLSRRFHIQCDTLDTKKRTHLDIFYYLAQIPNQWLEYWHKRQMMHDQFQNPKELLQALLFQSYYCPKYRNELI